MIIENHFVIPFDLYILRFPQGAKIPPHQDKVTNGRHFRLNILLKKAKKGGEFICHQSIFASSRVNLFRSDLAIHAVTQIEEGTRYVLSLGWLLK